MTAAQTRLLRRAVDSVDRGRRSVYVPIEEEATARDLERAGYGRVGVSGWLITFAPTAKARTWAEG
jgi:hypothetical protein